MRKRRVNSMNKTPNQQLGKLEEETLSESDIRPDDLVKQQEAIILKDVERLIRRSDEFVKVACPACQSTENVKKYEKYSLNYRECCECETLYISPRPTEETLEDCYQKSEVYAFWNKHMYPASEEARRNKIYAPRVDRVLELCQKYKIPTNSVLEVGAAYGTFCLEMYSRGVFKRIVGVEPTPDLAQTSRDKGIEIIQKPIEKVQFEETFDVTVSFEVIEHLFSPKKFIEHCYHSLSPKGLFVVTCPNGKGFDIELLGPLSNSVDHEHLNYFNPESLSLLLERSGFKVLEKLTPGKLDAELVRKKALSGELDLSGDTFLKRILIDEWSDLGVSFQGFLAKNNLSSHMWIVAQKR